MIRPLEVPTTTPTQAGEAYASAQDRCFAYLANIHNRLQVAMDYISSEDCTWSQAGEVERLAEELRQATRIADLHYEAALRGRKF